MLFYVPNTIATMFVRCVAHLNVQNYVLHCATCIIIALPVVLV